MKRTGIFIIASLIAVMAGTQAEAQEGTQARAQEKRMAVVETSTCYMRIKPDYESALETQELMGTVVEIVGEEGYWREIVSPQPYKAWTTEKTLVEMSPEQIRAYEDAPKYIFTGLYGHIFSEPAEKSQTITDLVGGDVMLAVLKNTDGTASGAGRSRFVTKGKWAAVMLPSGRTGWVKKEHLRPLGARIDIKQGDKAEGLVSAEKMEDIIASAMKLLGSPYLWGGMSAKGVDCSGMVRISAIMNDVLLPRNASQIINCGSEVEMRYDESFWNETDRLSADGEFKTEFVEEMNVRVKNLKRGDLVFFGTPATAEKARRITHVGIYLGDNRIIHSSHKVRINSLIPGEADYYENSHNLIAARRLK